MNKWIRIILIVVFAAVFLGSGYMLLTYFTESQQSQSEFDELAQLVQQATPTESVTPVLTTPPADSDSQGETPEPTQPQPLPEYIELSALNPDVAGWLRIDGTKVNYPVMHTPDRVDYYLRRNFYGQYSSHGCLYAREQCSIDPASDNITIYGHNMKDGSMFGALAKYRKKSFWEDHKIINFDTLMEHHTYEIFAVFTTTASKGKGFSYHQFVNAKSQEKFDEFVQTCLELSLYDTGIVPQYGDNLITLSTCEYTQNNGRLVVVARRVD